MKFLLLGIRGLHYFGRIAHLQKERHTTAHAFIEKKGVCQIFFVFFLIQEDRVSERTGTNGLISVNFSVIDGASKGVNHSERRKTVEK